MKKCSFGVINKSSLNWGRLTVGSGWNLFVTSAIVPEKFRWHSRWTSPIENRKIKHFFLTSKNDEKGKYSVLGLGRVADGCDVRWDSHKFYRWVRRAWRCSDFSIKSPKTLVWLHRWIISCWYTYFDESIIISVFFRVCLLLSAAHEFAWTQDKHTREKRRTRIISELWGVKEEDCKLICRVRTFFVEKRNERWRKKKYLPRNTRRQKQKTFFVLLRISA